MGVVLLLVQEVRVRILLQLDREGLGGMEEVVVEWLVNGKWIWEKQTEDLMEELLQDVQC
jgi:hypothetical protein